MADVLKYEARQLVRGTLALALLLGFFVLMLIYLYPSIETSAESIQQWMQSLPESMRESFGMEAYTTIEGFISTELYQFVWLLLVGLYLTYVAGGAIAGDVDTNRIDLLLATPISRTRLLLEKYLSLLIPIVALNLIVPLFVYAGVLAIGESIEVGHLVMLHVLSVPYLLFTGAVGLALSVIFSRADRAQRGGIAVVFLLFIMDSVTKGTDLSWMGAVSPTRYYDPADILVDGLYDFTGALILLAATLALVIFSAERFRRADL
ncbi:MAG: ABC transporter permease subunit [Halodesulfurarchaeum sp.]